VWECVAEGVLRAGRRVACGDAQVIKGMGLCLGCWEVHGVEALGGAPPSDGDMYVRADFSVVVFLPRLGSILEATLVWQSREGWRLELGGFAHVYVPASSMPDAVGKQAVTWVEAEQRWKLDTTENGKPMQLPAVVPSVVRCCHSD
jgi:DNA-directed RNA polymerase subunit E'/Rpb7